MRGALSSSGYEAVTIEGLAEAAGVSKQTIYRWWPSKAAILGEALLEGELPEVELPMTDDLAADLKAMFAVQGQDAETIALARALIAVTATDPELGARLNERLAAPIREWTAERLALGVSAGEVRADVDAAVVADQLIALGSYLALLGVPLGRENSDALSELVLRGIAAR
ncbi:AcrR family transcriptional regulator [Microbacterium natoriense]|uniref:AcrR family transcriptional regulator n=1 Tax=Microbacterium natoriense TaxID=284570 RepID=A0AAW8ESZ4_9MICO|nr:TetR/AcrR family transcriptional regulator [Microbacterium natoriense]MDQ0646560.1 AcrR family transcriptional regulator [Microbacterium natoriense]